MNIWGHNKQICPLNFNGPLKYNKQISFLLDSKLTKYQLIP